MSELLVRWFEDYGHTKREGWVQSYVVVPHPILDEGVEVMAVVHEPKTKMLNVVPVHALSVVRDADEA